MWYECTFLCDCSRSVLSFPRLNLLILACDISDLISKKMSRIGLVSLLSSSRSSLAWLCRLCVMSGYQNVKFHYIPNQRLIKCRRHIWSCSLYFHPIEPFQRDLVVVDALSGSNDTCVIRQQGTQASNHPSRQNHENPRPGSAEALQGLPSFSTAKWLRTPCRQGHQLPRHLQKSRPLPPSTSSPRRYPACTRSSTQHFSWPWARLNSRAWSQIRPKDC